MVWFVFFLWPVVVNRYCWFCKLFLTVGSLFLLFCFCLCVDCVSSSCCLRLFSVLCVVCLCLLFYVCVYSVVFDCVAALCSCQWLLICIVCFNCFIRVFDSLVMRF